MDQLTHNVRRANWLNIIKQCQERPANVTVRQWLKDNDIKEKSYYYWLRKFRKESYDQMQLPAATEEPAEVSFVEFAAPTSEKVVSTQRFAEFNYDRGYPTWSYHSGNIECYFRGSTESAPKGGNPCWRTLLKSPVSYLRVEQLTCAKALMVSR